MLAFEGVLSGIGDHVLYKKKEIKGGRFLYSQSTSAFVSLFIPRSKPDVQITKLVADEQNRLGRPLPLNTLLVLNALKDMPHSDVKQLAETLRISETLVRTVLEQTIEQGLVEAYGAGRGRNYMLSHAIYREKSKTAGYVRQRDIDESRFEELILNLAREYEFISRADIVSLLHVKPSKAYTLLKALADRGKLEPINKGRYAKYRLLTQ